MGTCLSLLCKVSHSQLQSRYQSLSLYPSSALVWTDLVYKGMLILTQYVKGSGGTCRITKAMLIP